MKKEDVVRRMAEFADVRKMDAARCYTMAIEAIRDAILEDGEFRLTNIGTFRVKTVRAHNGRNPQTGETITVPETKRLSFKPTAAMREAVRAR